MIWLASIGFLSSLGAGIISPILPLYAAGFNVPLYLIGLAVSAHSLGNACFSLPGGILADRIRTSKLLKIGIWILLFGTVIITLASDYWILLAGRILQGVGVSLFQMSSMVYIGRNVIVENRGKANAVFWGVISTGFATGPAVGGVIGRSAGLTAPFLFYTLLIGAALIIIYLFLRFTPEEEAVASTMRITLKQYIRTGFTVLKENRHLLALGILVLLYYFVRSGVTLAIAPLYGYYNLNLDSATVGVILALTSYATVLVIFPMGAYSDKHGRRGISQLTILVGVAALILLPVFPNPFFFSAGMVFFGVSVAAAGFASAWASDLLPKEKMGMGLGAFRVLLELGIGGGPFGLTLITSLAGIQVGEPISSLPFYVSAAILLLVSLSMGRIRDPAALGKKLSSNI